MNIPAILQNYQNLLETLDQTCREIQQKLKNHPCKIGCDLCCEQLFPLSFLEAYFLNLGFKKLDRKLRRELTRLAEKVAHLLSKINWPAYELLNSQKEQYHRQRKALTQKLNSLSPDCPFLKNHLCVLYPYRNHDCRMHGFSYDSLTREILGCPRFTPQMINDPHFRETLMDYNFLYPEKLKLDQELIKEVTFGEFPKRVFYYTSPLQPILKDYEKENWLQFFTEKFKNQKFSSENYSLILDFNF